MIRCARCGRTPPNPPDPPDVDDDRLHFDFEPPSGEDMAEIEPTPEGWVTLTIPDDHDFTEHPLDYADAADDDDVVHLCPDCTTADDAIAFMNAIKQGDADLGDAATLATHQEHTAKLNDLRARGLGEGFDFDEAERDLDVDEPER